LDWAITDAEPRWGVTAPQAVEETDAGPVWGSRSFSIARSRPGTIAYPALSPPRDAAVDVTIGEFVERVAFDDSGSLEGVPVRLSGFVVGIDGRDDAFLLTRFVIACGAADAFPVQAIVNTTDVPPNDTWLEVVGTWVSDDLGPGAAGRSATIEAQLTRLIARPENPYDR